MTKLKPTKDYRELMNELDNIMVELQREDIGVDQALSQYERGLELIKNIEEYLKTAENKVKELKAKFSSE